MGVHRSTMNANALRKLPFPVPVHICVRGNSAVPFAGQRSFSGRDSGNYNHRRRSGFAIEAGDALLHGIRVRSVGGVGHQDLIVAVLAAQPRPAVRLRGSAA
jgi:hypothetical protein